MKPATKRAKWRTLQPGETIRKGDQCRGKNGRGWENAEDGKLNCVGIKVNNFCAFLWRRKVKEAQP